MIVTSCPRRRGGRRPTARRDRRRSRRPATSTLPPADELGQRDQFGAGVAVEIERSRAAIASAVSRAIVASRSASAPVSTITCWMRGDVGIGEVGRRRRASSTCALGGGCGRRRLAPATASACPRAGRRRPACRWCARRRTRPSRRRASGRHRRAAARRHSAPATSSSNRSGAASAAPRWSGRSIVYLPDL